jgi:hypothetical protein
MCFFQGELRVSVLPTHLSYDAPWPVRKVPLRCTPHFIAYNRESKVRYEGVRDNWSASRKHSIKNHHSHANGFFRLMQWFRVRWIPSKLSRDWELKIESLWKLKKVRMLLGFESLGEHG